jgi:uncharacterized protein YebE (UPF0316 family)
VVDLLSPTSFDLEAVLGSPYEVDPFRDGGRIVALLIAVIFPTAPILPLLVFLAETCVVTLCTVRTICLTRGRKVLAAGLGFFEVSIWLFAIGQIMQNLSSLPCYLAFATGFSLGNFLGVLIEKKLAIGNLVVHITTNRNPGRLIESLRAAKYGVTALDGRGATGPVQVVFTVIKRKHLANIVAIIKDFDSRAFYSVHDLQSAAAGIFRSAPERMPRMVPSALRIVGPPAGRF